MPNVSISSSVAASIPPACDLMAWQAAEHDSSVLVADGSQVKVTVRDGHLSVSDGLPGAKRERRFPRVPRKLARLVILGGHGFVTLEAQRWLASSGVPWVVIDTYSDDAPIATSGPQREDARLLRAQAFATECGPLEAAGLKVTAALIAAKLEGQAKNLDEVFHAGNEACKVRDLAVWVRKAETLPDCRTLEAQGAVIYWQVWAGRVHTPFSPSDMVKVPGHWLTFAGRTSMVYDYEKNKDATDPVNAMLNYVYRIGETEAIHACHAFGLHPALGILHADRQGRDSMALDLLEAIRPAIDRIVLNMLDTGLGIPYGPDGKPRYLDRRNFHETKDGTVRLVPPLTHTLAGHAAQWGADIRAHTEAAARVLALAASGDVAVPRARKYVQGSRAPLSSSKRARLRDGTGPADLLPDDVWRKVAALIPAPPRRPSGRTGRPVDVSRDRVCVAALAAHELLGVPWGAVPVQVPPQTCQARLKAWSWLNAPGEDRPAWQAMQEVIQASGYLSALLAA
jgi:CRISPR-associated endonuclease Cas1